MAQPEPEAQVPPASPSGFRVTQRTYSGDTTPLAEVLVLLYDWSVERQLRVQAKVATRPAGETDPL